MEYAGAGDFGMMLTNEEEGEWAEGFTPEDDLSPGWYRAEEAGLAMQSEWVAILSTPAGSGLAEELSPPSSGCSTPGLGCMTSGIASNDQLVADGVISGDPCEQARQMREWEEILG